MEKGKDDIDTNADAASTMAVLAIFAVCLGIWDLYGFGWGCLAFAGFCLIGIAMCIATIKRIKRERKEKLHADSDPL